MQKILTGLKNIISKPSPELIKLFYNASRVPQLLFAGENLMDVTNKLVNSDINIYGLCDKQLACTTCSVQIQSHQQYLKEPSEQQLDVLTTIPSYKTNTRMACQINLTKQMDGMAIRILNKQQSQN